MSSERNKKIILKMFANLIMLLLIIGSELHSTFAAMSMKQMEQSLAMFRKTCLSQTGADPALVDGIHRGEFPEDKDLKCFSMCVAKAAGTLNKKGDLVEAKVKSQVATVLPEQLRPAALGALEACKDVYKNYKDPCDKSFYATKCMYDFSPKDFLYP